MHENMGMIPDHESLLAFLPLALVLLWYGVALIARRCPACLIANFITKLRPAKRTPIPINVRQDEEYHRRRAD